MFTVIDMIHGSGQTRNGITLRKGIVWWGKLRRQHAHLFFLASTLVMAPFITPAAFARFARHRGHDSKADARVRIRRAPRRRGSAHLVYDILVAHVPLSRYRTPAARAEHGLLCPVRRRRVNMDDRRGGTVRENSEVIVIASSYLSTTQIAHTLSCQWRC